MRPHSPPLYPFYKPCVCSAPLQAAALPCEGGTYSSATDLQSATECTNVDAGSFATTGSEVQTQCAKGSFTAASTLPKDKCTLCAGGEYQDEGGTTACKACTAGHYCPDGAVSECFAPT